MILKIFVIYFLSVVIMMSLGLLGSIVMNIKASIALTVPFIVSITLGLSSIKYVGFNVVVSKLFITAVISLLITCVYLTSCRLHSKGVVYIESR